MATTTSWYRRSCMDVTRLPTDSSLREDAAVVRRGVAVGIVLGSGLAALCLGSAALWLVRDQLHVGCSMGETGSEGAGTWTCSDGIGYLGVAVALGALWLITTLLGAVVAGLVRRDRVAGIVLGALAMVSMAAILGLTKYWSGELVYAEQAPMTGEDAWRLAVGPAAIASCISLIVMVAGLLSWGRRATILLAAAAVGVVVATIFQPGLSINTLPAAGLLAAAAIRASAPADSPPI